MWVFFFLQQNYRGATNITLSYKYASAVNYKILLLKLNGFATPLLVPKISVSYNNNINASLYYKLDDSERLPFQCLRLMRLESPFSLYFDKLFRL